MNLVNLNLRPLSLLLTAGSIFHVYVSGSVTVFAGKQWLESDSVHRDQSNYQGSKRWTLGCQVLYTKIFKLLIAKWYNDSVPKHQIQQARIRVTKTLKFQKNFYRLPNEDCSGFYYCHSAHNEITWIHTHWPCLWQSTCILRISRSGFFWLSRCLSYTCYWALIEYPRASGLCVRTRAYSGYPKLYAHTTTPPAEIKKCARQNFYLYTYQLET